MDARVRPLLLLLPGTLAAIVAVSALKAGQPTAPITGRTSSDTKAILPAPQMLDPGGAEDFSYGDTATVRNERATAEETESKLFFTDDNRWWGVLGVSTGVTTPGLYLFEFVDHAWQRRLRLPGADAWAKADTVYDSDTARLFVAVRAKDSPTSGDPRVSKLYELRYEGSGSWTKRAGPTTITTESPEVLTIALDSTGRLWATYMSEGRLRVRSKGPKDVEFDQVRTPASTAMPDDISAVVAWGAEGAGRIGVLWSDQGSRRFRFAWREDGSPLTEQSWNLETAYGGVAGVGGCPTDTSTSCADDHISVKAYGGRVFAAVKTSLNDVATPDPDDPLIVVLERRDDTSSWRAHPVTPVVRQVTSPTLLVAPDMDALLVFAPRFQRVFFWSSPLSTPTFGGAVPWAQSGPEAVASTTKQVVTEQSGAVVEVSHHRRRVYMHNELQFIDSLQSPLFQSPSPSPPTPVETP